MITRQEALARHRVLSDGETPPGRAGVDGTWEGDLCWLTCHGPALILWTPCGAFDAWDVRFGDSRIDVQRQLDVGFRRAAAGDRCWICGHLDISPEDAVFTDGKALAQPVFRPDDCADMVRDMAHDEALRADLQDFTFARALCACLENSSFTHIESGESWDYGIRDAAFTVATVRDCGNSYMDFFMSGHVMQGALPGPRTQLIAGLKASGADEATLQNAFANAELFDRIDQHLNRIGWHANSPDDYRKYSHIACRRRIRSRLALLAHIRDLERTDAGDPQDWVEPASIVHLDSISIEGLDNLSDDEIEAAGGSLRDRIHALAETARIDEDTFYELLAEL